MKTAILTDSGSAMTIQQAQEHGIFLLPLQVIDEELKRLMDAAADTPMFKQFGESK